MAIIYEFDPQIYPRLVWVAINPSRSDLEKFFGRYATAIKDMDETYDAQCWATGREFPDQRGGVLVIFKSKVAMTADTMAHEATHLAMMIFDYVGATPNINDQEPFAYLVGWITRCINVAKKSKLK